MNNPYKEIFTILAEAMRKAKELPHQDSQSLINAVNAISDAEFWIIKEGQDRWKES